LESLEQHEREKYQKIWSFPEYRRYSPGESSAPRAFDKLSMRSGQTLYDMGCGTGRAGQWFANKGLDVTLVDFAPNAPEVDLPFIEACLWGLPDMPIVDYVYCTDVLEHIPPEKVDDVIAGLKSVGKRLYLQIHCNEDGFGSLINERLHLTVQPPKWWVSKFPDCKYRDHANTVEIII